MTALQMKYLLSYAELKENERSMTAVAIELGVNKSTVSRVFALAVKEGILDEQHELTPYGKEYMQYFSLNLQKLTRFLSELGFDSDYAKEEAYQMIGACSEETIEALISNRNLSKQ